MRRPFSFPPQQPDEHKLEQKQENVDGSSARRELARAERARKKYERTEIKRFTEASRKRRRLWFISFLSASAFCGFIVLIAYSPICTLQNIRIEGAVRLDSSQIHTALSSELGKPLSLIDFSVVNAELETFSLIQSYATQAELPGTLVVHIVERKPIAVLVEGESFKIVDPAGVTLERSSQRPPNFPIIDTALSPVGSPTFQAITSVLRQLPPDFVAQIDLIGAATADSVSLKLAGPEQRTVFWGSAHNSELKLKILSALLAAQSSAGAGSFDVSSPQNPVIK